jgi:uncharacterized membrane protein (UPF0127 family)
MTAGYFGQRLTLAIVTVLALFPTVGTSVAAAQAPLVQIGNNKIKVEVASTPDQIQRGLMYRNSLAEDHGMVFLFRPANGVRFWMAHCFISLDMLMIKDGKIVRIFEDVPPCKAVDETECPTYPASNEEPVVVSEVLEVSAGYAKRHGIKTGDPVTFLLGNAQSRMKFKAKKSDKAGTTSGASK